MDDVANLEPLAARLEQSGDYRVLRRVPIVIRYADDDPATLKRFGLIVDIETTGLIPPATGSSSWLFGMGWRSPGQRREVAHHLARGVAAGGRARNLIR